MSKWYILPNGHIKHVDGLEIQPEKDWFPTDESMVSFGAAQRAAGNTEVQIVQSLMRLALECERWAEANLT